MEKLERYLQFMREAERLKNVLRSARTSTGRHESTAEHTWRLALLALVLADEKPELDLPRVLAMCLVHDLGEAYEGDIPAVAQCDPASKAAAELAAMERLTPLLPAEAAARIRTLWEEYEACATPEARWVKALDKAETILRTDRPELPNLLIFGDSFTNPLETLFYTGFNETRSLDLRYYDQKGILEYLEEYRPDVVICIRDDTAYLSTEGNGNIR